MARRQVRSQGSFRTGASFGGRFQFPTLPNGSGSRAMAATCWRDHAKRDGRATVGVHVNSNSVRCFKCDSRNLSAIDLVRDVRGLSVGAAFRWFESEWPDVPKVRLKVTTDTRGNTQNIYRGYTARRWDEVSCDVLALSPAWSRLSHAEKAIAAAIIARFPRERDVHPLLTCSYPELQSWAGVGDRHTIARALAKLRTIGLVQTALVPTGRETPHGFATRQTLLRLTWHSRRFQSWLAAPRGFARRGVRNATGSTVVVSPLRSGDGKGLEEWKPARGERVQ